MHFPTWIDLKGQDSVPDTVHHVVSLASIYWSTLLYFVKVLFSFKGFPEVLLGKSQVTVIFEYQIKIASSSFVWFFQYLRENLFTLKLGNANSYKSKNHLNWKFVWRQSGTTVG